MAKIDLGARLTAAFGYVSANQSENLRKQRFAEDNGIANAGVYNSDSTFEELTIKKNANEALFFGSMLSKVDTSSVFGPPPIISFSRAKNLIITPIDGSDGEVVERYGTRPWELRIQGILIDMENHQYPSAKVKTLNSFFEVNATLAVESVMLDDLGIKSIFLLDLQVAGVAGFADTIQYSAYARAIKPVEFFFVKSNS